MFDDDNGKKMGGENMEKQPSPLLCCFLLATIVDSLMIKYQPMTNFIHRNLTTHFDY